MLPYLLVKLRCQPLEASQIRCCIFLRLLSLFGLYRRLDSLKQIKNYPFTFQNGSVYKSYKYSIGVHFDSQLSFNFF